MTKYSDGTFCLTEEEYVSTMSDILTKLGYRFDATLSKWIKYYSDAIYLVTDVSLNGSLKSGDTVLTTVINGGVLDPDDADDVTVLADGVAANASLQADIKAANESLIATIQKLSDEWEGEITPAPTFELPVEEPAEEAVEEPAEEIPAEE